MTTKNYSIYKIFCKDSDVKDIYVGSTTRIKDRIKTHKTTLTNPNNPHSKYKLYTVIKENGGWDNWIITEIESYPCETQNEILIRERFWIENLNADLNKKIPSRTKKEYTEINKEKTKEYKKKYRIENKQEISDKKKIYQIENKQELSDKKKERYKENKKEKLDKCKIYRNINKEKIKQFKSEKIICECGCITSNCHISRHRKTKKHLELLNTLIDS